MLLYSAALAGVLGATGACKLASRCNWITCLSFLFHRYYHPWDRETRTRFSRHDVLLFAVCAWFHVRVCTCFLPEEQSEFRPLQHDIIQDPSCDTQTSFVACCAASHRYIWLHRAGVLLNTFILF